MPQPPREYHRPENLEAALQLLRRGPARTALLVLGPRPAAIPEREVEVVIDLSRLNLAYIKESADIVHLGALTSLQDLADSHHLQTYAGGLLPEATRLAAHLGLRHLATLSGVLASREGPPEVLLALLVLNAAVVVLSPSDQAGEGEVVTVHVADLSTQQVEVTRQGGLQEIRLVDYLTRARPVDELILELKFARPGAARVGCALERVARTPRDEAIVAAAALLEVEANGVVGRVRLAIAGASPQPRRFASVERLLKGQPLTPAQLQAAAEAAVAEANPASDFRASAEYRQAMAGTLAHRALAEARRRTESA